MFHLHHCFENCQFSNSFKKEYIAEDRALDEVHIFISIMPISSPNPMFEHHRDDSNKWSNIGFGEEITHAVSIEVNFIHLIIGSVVIWGSLCTFPCFS